MNVILFLSDALKGLYSLFLSVSSISGFPPRLSAAEEGKDIEEWAMGNGAAREERSEHDLRLVVFIASKFESPGAGA